MIVSRPSIVRRPAPVVAVLCVCLGVGPAASGQEVLGPIPSHFWLALGPFSHDIGCGGRRAQLLTDHVAPTRLELLAPEEGDEVEYDPELASTLEYFGPPLDAGVPTWRFFDDGTEDEDLDMEQDALIIGAPTDNVVTFVVTYFEYEGDEPIDIELCTGSDDALLVLLDTEVVVAKNVCRGRGQCQELTPVTVTPGLHRILMGVWERGGQFGASLGLAKDGVLITDLDPDWNFLGPEGGGFQFADAKIVAEPTRGVEPLEVSFDATMSTVEGGDTIEEFRWDFGDGESATGPMVTHTYEERGVYRARLGVLTSAGAVSIATETIVVLLPGSDLSPWTGSFIGEEFVGGTGRFVGGCLQGFAGGRGLVDPIPICDPCEFDLDDQFFFINREVGVEASITARIDETEIAPLDGEIVNRGWQGREGGRVGVMIRESLESDSPFTFMGLWNEEGQLKPVFVRRRRGGEPSLRTIDPGILLEPADAWVRVERNGATLRGLVSDNGEDWTLFSRTRLDSPAETMFAGLVVSAGDSREEPEGIFADVTFCDIEIEGLTATGFVRGDANADGQVNITDALTILGFLFLGEAAPPCLDAADVDDNGGTAINDGIGILGWLFQGGNAPRPPTPADSDFGPESCGPDPTDDDLECAFPPPECQ